VGLLVALLVGSLVALLVRASRPYPIRYNPLSLVAVGSVCIYTTWLHTEWGFDPVVQ